MHLIKGFTLIELIIVITIISTLTFLGISSYKNIQTSGQATRVATDFEQIKLSAKIWKNATDRNYPRNFFLPQNPDYTCFTSEPAVSQVAGFQTYLDKIYRDPWGRQYTYRNNGTTFTNSGTEPTDRGVNVIMRWCGGEGQRYINLARKIDAILDGDGNRRTGFVRWDDDPDTPGAVIYLISANENL